MAMHRAAIVVTLFGVVFAVPAWSQTQNEGMPRPACLSSAESRDLFVADKLIQPFRVMRETAKALQAEAIDIQLCRTQGTLVYDVTLLDQQGRVLHKLINATTGVAMASPMAGSEPGPAPRPFVPGPRPAPDLYPGVGPDPSFGRRFRPNFFQGPRPGPYFYQGPRPGGPFFQRPGPGERGPGAME